MGCGLILLSICLLDTPFSISMTLTWLFMHLVPAPFASCHLCHIHQHYNKQVCYRHLGDSGSSPSLAPSHRHGRGASTHKPTVHLFPEHKRASGAGWVQSRSRSCRTPLGHRRAYTDSTYISTTSANTIATSRSGANESRAFRRRVRHS